MLKEILSIATVSKNSSAQENMDRTTLSTYLKLVMSRVPDIDYQTPRSFIKEKSSA